MIIRLWSGAGLHAREGGWWPVRVSLIIVPWRLYANYTRRSRRRMRRFL